MLGLLPERGREKVIGQTKEPQPYPILPHAKQTSSCQQAKYNKSISLNAAADSTPPTDSEDIDEMLFNVAFRK